MYLCEDGHDEIVHDYMKHDCPVCKIIEEKETEIEALEDMITTLEDDVKELDAEIDKLEDRINTDT